MAGGHVTIVGTAHVSPESADEVRRAIRDEHPDVVAVELDSKRYESLQEIRDRGDEYGADMLAAVDEAEELGIPVSLIDRDIVVTLRRFWGAMSLIERLKMLGAIAAGFLGIGGVSVEEIEEVLEDDRVQSYVDEFRRFSPSGARVLIDERDAYMAARLLDLSRRGDDVVAVIGAGHEEGVRGYLDHPDEIPDLVEESAGIVREPSYDVVIDGEETVVRVDLAGFDREDVATEYRDGALVVDASRSKAPEPGYHYVEEERPDRCHVAVPVDGVTAEDATGRMCDDGVLEVRLPRC